MSLRDWLATATPATTATPNQNSGQYARARAGVGESVATVATVAGVEESGDGYRIDYTPADLAEFDALLERYCALIERPDKRGPMLAARKRMCPATIAAELAEFRALVVATATTKDR